METMSLLERFCDLLSADDFRAVASAFPGLQEVYIPEGSRRGSKNLSKIEEAIGKEKTQLLVENWGGLHLFIPSVYMRSRTVEPAALYTELFEKNRPIGEIAEEYVIHPWQLLLILCNEVRRRRDIEICENLYVNENSIELSARIGMPPSQIRLIAIKKRKALPQPKEADNQLFLFNPS
jgi:hypothetical protein